LHDLNGGAAALCYVPAAAALQVQHLSQLHELLVKSDPALLDTFILELVEFQVSGLSKWS
jgi:hypothetical protein